MTIFNRQRLTNDVFKIDVKRFSNWVSELVAEKKKCKDGVVRIKQNKNL